MRTLRRAISMMQRIPRITPPSQMRDGQFAIRNFEVCPEKLDVGRWMLDVRASARHGPVAQRLEQGTHNLAFCLRRRSLHSTECEQTRRLATRNDGHNVNVLSTTFAPESFLIAGRHMMRPVCH